MLIKMEIHLTLIFRTVPVRNHLLFCSVCSLSFSVKFKGKSAIMHHAVSKKHKEGMDEKKKNKENMGIYLTKGKKEDMIDAEIALARFTAAHNISLKVRKWLLTGTVPVNNSLLIGTLSNVRRCLQLLAFWKCLLACRTIEKKTKV